MRFVLFDHVRLVLVAGYINMLLELVEAHGYIGPHKAALVKNGLDVAQLISRSPITVCGHIYL